MTNALVSGPVMTEICIPDITNNADGIFRILDLYLNEKGVFCIHVFKEKTENDRSSGNPLEVFVMGFKVMKRLLLDPFFRPGKNSYTLQMSREKIKEQGLEESALSDYDNTFVPIDTIHSISTTWNRLKIRIEDGVIKLPFKRAYREQVESYCRTYKIPFD